MAGFYLALVFLLQTHHQVTGYGSGAPTSTCFTQYPKHLGIPTQTSPSPFVVTFDPPAYVPGQDVTIQVVHNQGADFVGIQMAARRMAGNPQEIVGTFVHHETNKTKAQNCFGGYQNLLTHANNDIVNKMTVTWRPPNYNAGDLVFITTFVKTFQVFWHNVEVNLMVDSTEPLRQATYPGIPLNPMTQSINFDDCGDTKGCFYYPRLCSGSDCKAVATYRHRESTKDFVLELYLNTADANWVSIGFSDDETMGHDATMTCTVGVGQMSVQEGYNPAQFKYNERLFNLYSSSHEIIHKDGKIYCRFIVPEVITAYHIDQSVTDALNYTVTQWDLRKDWYLMMAWGNTLPESDALKIHEDMPPVSAQKIDVTEKVITFTSTFHTMVQVHATLMVIGWVFFAGITTIISRHFRNWFENSTMCGSKPWFQIHRIMAILVACLTVAGIIVIFTHYGTGIREMSTPHSYVGLAVVGCVGLQIIAGMLRPHPEHSFRPVFNIGHRFMGHAGHILAAACMFLAYEIKYINSDMRTLGIVSLSVWVGVQVFWHVMFEIITRYQLKKKTGGSNAYRIDENDLKPEDANDSNTNGAGQYCPLTTTLVTFALTLAGVTAGVIVPIYTY